MAAIVHQDRWSNGSAQSTATFYSDDGGRPGIWPTPITRCSGGLQEGPESFDRASDPWLTVTPGEPVGTTMTTTMTTRTARARSFIR